INGGTNKTVTTSSGSSVTVSVPTGSAGSFVYTLVSVQDASSTACSQIQAGSATVVVNPLPTASISGTTSLCQNSPAPVITCTGTSSVTVANANAPTFFVAKSGPATFCQGDSVTLTATCTANCNNVAYSWNTGATSASIKVKTQGLYGVTATNSDGCDISVLV